MTGHDRTGCQSSGSSTQGLTAHGAWPWLQKGPSQRFVSYITGRGHSAAAKTAKASCNRGLQRIERPQRSTVLHCRLRSCFPLLFNSSQASDRNETKKADSFRYAAMLVNLTTWSHGTGGTGGTGTQVALQTEHRSTSLHAPRWFRPERES